MSAEPLNTVLSKLPSLTSEDFLIGSGARADCIWTRCDFLAICDHMLNGNSPHDFMLAYRKDGKPKFAKAKDAKADRRAAWTWDSIIGKSKEPVGIGFYPTNPNQLSRWGAMDFDAHDGNALRARGLAVAAFRVLVHRPELYLMLGTSGSEGWHLFAFTRDFHPVANWTLLLKQVAASIGTPVQAGICEVFPNEVPPGSWGHGIRAPGTWNPKTDAFGSVVYNGLSPLIAEKKGIRKESPFLSHATDREKTARLHDRTESSLYRGSNDEWREQFAITQPATRHAQLKALVLHIFHQVGSGIARLNAEAQFHEAIPQPQATLAEHLEEFDEIWRWMETQWRAELPTGEQVRLDTLPTGVRQDTYRIVRSFARKCEQDDISDFPFPVEHVAARVGVSYQAMSKVRKDFVARGVIEKTAQHVPNVRAARFRWLDSVAPDEPF